MQRLTNSASLHPITGNVAGFEYALAPTGHRLAAISSMGDGSAVRQHEYTYDPLYQLTGESLDTGGTRSQLTYNYDAVGNRLTRTVARLRIRNAHEFHPSLRFQ
jgi:YD repeat-containing protein